MKIPCPIARAAAMIPEAVAIHTGTRSLIYTHYNQLINSLALSLVRYHISPGDRVEIIADNSLEYAALIFALVRIGAIAVPINTRLIPANWKEMIDDTPPKLLVADETHLTLLGDIAANHIDIMHLVHDSKANSIALDGDSRPEIDLDIDSSIIFTSGSGGKPKGVILTNANHYFSALGSNENIKLSQGDCWHLTLPLFHVGGLSILYRSALAGSAVRIADRFDPSQVNDLIDSGLVTHLSLVPTMLVQLLQDRNNRPLPKSLKAILLGGGAVMPTLLEDIRRLALPVLTSYGMTETASQICTLSTNDPPDKLVTSGRKLKYREICILDESNNPLKSGEVGEISVRGEVLFRGYWGTQQSSHITNENWFRTGDLGFLDSEGCLTVIGRRDEMFVSGGENIHPQEIERAAITFPNLAACAVIVVDDNVWGKRQVLYIESESPELFDSGKLTGHLSQRLAAFKLPKEIIILKSLPRKSIDKIDKAKLLQIYLESKI